MKCKAHLFTEVHWLKYLGVLSGSVSLFRWPYRESVADSQIDAVSVFSLTQAPMLFPACHDGQRFPGSNFNNSFKNCLYGVLCTYAWGLVMVVMIVEKFIQFYWEYQYVFLAVKYIIKHIFVCVDESLANKYLYLGNVSWL